MFMSQDMSISSDYFKQYRLKLGFANQNEVRNFFGAKTIIPTIDLNYLNLLNERLYEIADRLNSIVTDEVKPTDLSTFKKDHINHPFKIMRDNNILPVLNNLGRRPEQVYYSWMRGYIISNFFLKSLEHIFQVNTANISLIGDDDLKNIETFKKTPKADIEINFAGNKIIRIEMQSGFTGTNDIKQHKVLEAKRVFREEGLHTMVVHIDLYNGQAAFIKIDQIEDSNINWITRQQMEGQTVFNIDQNYFIWKITEPPINYNDIAIT